MKNPSSLRDERLNLQPPTLRLGSETLAVCVQVNIRLEEDLPKRLRLSLQQLNDLKSLLEKARQRLAEMGAR
jgi:hypothetical protein